MGERKVVLALNAHPDDAEFMCAGTLALLPFGRGMRDIETGRTYP